MVVDKGSWCLKLFTTLHKSLFVPSGMEFVGKCSNKMPAQKGKKKQQPTIKTVIWTFDLSPNS